MNRIDLTALRDRVRAATGPDRMLDYDIWAEVDPPGRKRTSDTQNLRMPWPEWRKLHWEDAPQSTYGIPDNHQDYTASLDASLALVERSLPGTLWAVGSMEEGPFCNLVVADRKGGYIGGGRHGEAATAPLAVLDAILSTLIAREGAKPEDKFNADN